MALVGDADQGEQLAAAEASGAAGGGLVFACDTEVMDIDVT
jgi:hypothetical protein